MAFIACGIGDPRREGYQDKVSSVKARSSCRKIDVKAGIVSSVADGTDYLEVGYRKRTRNRDTPQKIW